MKSPLVKQFVCFAACLTIMGLVNAGLHDTPAASAAQLTVTVVSASLDTVWVDLSLSGYNAQACINPIYCSYGSETSYNVTPCVLAAPAAWLLCNGEGKTIGYIRTPQRLALEPGITYSMKAGFASWASTYGSSGLCDNLSCGYIDNAELVYTGSTTPTKPTTWGKVKALYRSP